MALGTKPFDLNCIESKPGHEQQISCVNVLTACQWSNVKHPDNSGTFWAAEDMSLKAILAELGSRGFILPDNNKP